MAKGMSLMNLRVHLEKAQQGYLNLTALKGLNQTGGSLILSRDLKIGAVHNRINLPYKWFIGSYVEFPGID